jgi:chromosome segregation ATPase
MSKAARVSHVRTKSIIVLLLCAIVMPMVHPVSAAEKGEPDVVGTLKKAQGMLRQLNQEKTALEAKVTELETKVSSMNSDLETKKKSLEATTREKVGLELQVAQKTKLIETLHNNNAILHKNNEIIKAENARVVEKVQQLESQIALGQQDNQLLVRAVKEREEWINKCQDKNKALLKFHKNILSEYQEPDFLDKMKTLEPLTGIRRVELENKVIEYRYQMESMKVTPWEDPKDSNNGTVAP